VKKDLEIAQIVIDADHAEGLIVIPSALWTVDAFLLVVGVEGVFASFLKVRNVLAHHRLIDLGEIGDLHHILAPLFKQPERCFITHHCLRSKLPRVAINHVFIDLVLKVGFHQKLLLFIGILSPNEQEEFVASEKFIYRIIHLAASDISRIGSTP